MKNPQSSRLKRALDEEDIKYMKLEILRDSRLVEILRKLVKDGGENIPILPPDADNWAIRRAFADGQLKELDWLMKILNWSD